MISSEFHFTDGIDGRTREYNVYSEAIAYLREVADYYENEASPDEFCESDLMCVEVQEVKNLAHLKKKEDGTIGIWDVTLKSWV